MLVGLFNLFSGILCLHLAIHPMWRQNRPMTWTRFNIGVGLGLLNIVLAAINIGAHIL